MAGTGGKRPNAGRKKGVGNKTTQSVKEAITLAFEKRGGVTALIKWADENQTEFYKLWGRLIPTDVKVTGEVSIASVVQEARERAAKGR